jgi:hypothetical protein
LQSVGFTQEQSKALVRIIAGLQSAHLATRADLVETREALRGEMASLELRLSEKMSAPFTKVIVWMVGTAIASVTLMATIGQLLK